tara:strand:+ start:54 stop:269 length:216 start_codon:yes stop_codon:yes gene_type:complete
MKMKIKLTVEEWVSEKTVHEIIIDKEKYESLSNSEETNIIFEAIGNGESTIVDKDYGDDTQITVINKEVVK